VTEDWRAKPVRTTPEANLQLFQIELWWAHNRDKAPDLFERELERTFDLISRFPAAGKSYPHPTEPHVRRILMVESEFFVFYREEDDHVVVMSIWSAVRGRGPDLGPGAG